MFLSCSKCSSSRVRVRLLEFEFGFILMSVSGSGWCFGLRFEFGFWASSTSRVGFGSEFELEFDVEFEFELEFRIRVPVRVHVWVRGPACSHSRMALWCGPVPISGGKFQMLSLLAVSFLNWIGFVVALELTDVARTSQADPLLWSCERGFRLSPASCVLSPPAFGSDDVVSSTCVSPTSPRTQFLRTFQHQAPRY